MGINILFIALYTVLNNLLILTELSVSTAKISYYLLSFLLISAFSIAFYIKFKRVIISNNNKKDLI